jgi:Domain of unknown function (DUF3362)
MPVVCRLGILSFVQMAPDIATCMYYAGVDPFSGQEVHVARHLRDRKLQRTLLQFFKPENYFEVRQALLQAGRGDLIGGGCDALIPAQAPQEAPRARREHADEATRGEFVHRNPRRGYRPGRVTQERQRKPGRGR